MSASTRQGLKLLSDSSFNFSASTTLQDEFGLPNELIKRIWLRLKGTWTPSAVTVPGTVVADGAAALVTKVVAQIDGKEWKSGSLASFLRLGELYDQASGVVKDIYTGAAIAQEFDILVPLCAEAAGSVSPIDSLIDGRVSRKLQLEVTYGAAADLVTGETATLTLTSTSVEVYYEATEAFDVTAPFWTNRESEQPFNTISTADQADFPLTYEQGVVVRAYQIRQVDAGDMTEDLIDKISLLINGTKEIPLADLKDGFIDGYTRFNFGVVRRAKGYIHIEVCERNNDGSLVLSTGLGAQGRGDEVNSVALRMKTVAGSSNPQIVVHKVEMVPQQLAA